MVLNTPDTTDEAAPTVVIVDDHGLFRAGVRTELIGAVRIVGEAGDVAGAVRVVLATRPDVVLLDVHMPDGGGLQVIQAVLERRPGQRFLALTVSDAPEDVIAIVRAGARGYVQKSEAGRTVGAQPASAIAAFVRGHGRS